MNGCRKVGKILGAQLPLLTAAIAPWVAVSGIVLPSQAQTNIGFELAEDTPLEQVTSVSQLTDVKPTDWAFQALQSLVERYGCLVGYPDRTYRGNRALSRYEFAAGLNACMDRINELISAATAELARREDLVTIQKLQEEFAAELAVLRGRTTALEARTTTLEAQQFSTTTKLNAQLILAVSDTAGDRVGGNSDESQLFLANRARLNFETSFSGKDLLRVRLQFGNFLNNDSQSQIASVTRTSMTRLNFDTDTENLVTIPHVRYFFPVSDSVSFVVGPAGIGFTDITDTITPPTVADDGLGVPSLFGEYSPFYRQGGGGGAVNWSITRDVILTLGYLAGDVSDPSAKNGLFNGNYIAMAQLAFYGKWGGIGLGYSHAYGPGGRVGLVGGTGSFLANTPFGDAIATSTDTVNISGFYRIAPNFNIHAWGGYLWAKAETSGLSLVANGIGGGDQLFVSNGDTANIWYAALGLTFPDVGGKGSMPGILVGLPPRVTESDVREERDRSYHLEAFYRFQVNDKIAITPGFWVILNPENDSRNATQYVGVIRTTFNF